MVVIFWKKSFWSTTCCILSEDGLWGDLNLRTFSGNSTGGICE